jgi:ABC-type lipoprotein export system ATPase subunit
VMVTHEAAGAAIADRVLRLEAGRLETENGQRSPPTRSAPDQPARSDPLS